MPSAGRKVQLAPGRVLLAEDVTGKGHTTRVGADEDLVMLLVPLAPRALSSGNLVSGRVPHKACRMPATAIAPRPPEHAGTPCLEVPMNSGSTRTIMLAATLGFGLVFGAVASAQDRLPPIPADKLTPAQKKAVDEYKKTRGGEPGGPWAVLTRSPDLMSRTLMLSDYLRFNSTLAPRLSEFVILMTAREWGQNYEWNAHQPLAVKGGLNPEVAKAIAEGRRPAQMAEDEASLYD